MGVFNIHQYTMVISQNQSLSNPQMSAPCSAKLWTAALRHGLQLSLCAVGLCTGSTAYKLGLWGSSFRASQLAYKCKNRTPQIISLNSPHDSRSMTWNTRIAKYSSGIGSQSTLDMSIACKAKPEKQLFKEMGVWQSSGRSHGIQSV